MISVEKRSPGEGMPGVKRGKMKGEKVKVIKGKVSRADTGSDQRIWRGYGGRHPTRSSVEFDRQLDNIAIWLEEWGHQERCRVIEGLLRRSNFTQFQFLHTVTQPVLHRDFMYAAQNQFPNVEFKPVSTHTSRHLKDKLVRTHQDNFYRVKSAYFQLDDEVKQQMREKHTVKFPDLLHSNGEPTVPPPATSKSRQTENSTTTKSAKHNVTIPVSKSTSSLPKISQASEAKKLRNSFNQSNGEIWVGDGANPLTSGAPAFRFVEMPIRRHIQDEHSPRNVTGSDSSSNDHDGRRRSSSTSKSDSLQELRKTKAKKKVGLCRSPSYKPLSEEAKILFEWYEDRWTDVRRNEFLHKFLLKLDPREHYFVSSFISVRQHRDFIALLPEHLALKIFGFLSPRELLVAARVNKTWQRLANNNELWKSKCQAVQLEVPVSDNPIWKLIFRDNMSLRLNWNEGFCRTVDLKGHTNNVLTVTFDNKRLASGSLDRTIKLWDIKSGALLQTLSGHSKGVWCLDFFTKNLLISGSYDGTIKVWNLKTGSATRTMIAHEGPVWAMARQDNILVTASQDKTAKIWDIGRCKWLHTLEGHGAAIFAVDIDDSSTLVLTGSGDRSVRLWGVDNGRCKKVIWVSQTTSIMSISYSKGYFACSYGETICLYKVEGAKLINTYKEHYKRVENLQLMMVDGDKQEGMIVSAGKDGMVKYWDITKERSIQTFNGHNDAVNAIHFDELRIASASYDHKIRIWDFNI